MTPFRKTCSVSTLMLLLLLCCWQSSQAAAPANDNFENAIPLSGISINTSASNVDATMERGEPYHGDGFAGASVWWTWVAPSNGFAVVSTAGSITTARFEMDTLLGIYTGTSVSQLRPIASNDDDDENESYNSRVSFPITQGTTYHIAVGAWRFQGDIPEQGVIQLSIAYQEKLTRKTAARWTITDLKGVPMKSEDLANKVVLLNFWATWCGPCIAEIPDLIALQNKYREQGLIVVGVSIDEAISGKHPTSLVQSFANRHSITYPIGMSDPGSTIVRDYGGISAIPTTFVIGRDNTIRTKAVGARDLAYFESQVRAPLFEDTRIDIVRNGNDLKLVWPAPPGAFRIEYNEGSFAPSWQVLNGIVEAEPGGKSALRLETSPKQRFYRLRMD